jgi:hypothetical protein
MTPFHFDVRSSPETGHKSAPVASPLWARSRSRRNQINGIDSSARRQGFAPATETAEIRSALQASKSIQLQIAAVSSVRSLLRPHCFAELAAVTGGSPK